MPTAGEDTPGAGAPGAEDGVVGPVTAGVVAPEAGTTGVEP